MSAIRRLFAWLFGRSRRTVNDIRITITCDTSQVVAALGQLQARMDAVATARDRAREQQRDLAKQTATSVASAQNAAATVERAKAVQS